MVDFSQGMQIFCSYEDFYKVYSMSLETSRSTSGGLLVVTIYEHYGVIHVLWSIFYKEFNFMIFINTT